jgi:integrase
MYDASANQIHIPANVTKDRKARTIALGPALQRIIERRKARRVIGMDGTALLSEYFFHRDGAPVGEFKKSWATATKSAKCEGLLFHDLRRTCARRLLAAGVPTQVAKAITGA